MSVGKHARIGTVMQTSATMHSQGFMGQDSLSMGERPRALHLQRWAKDAGRTEQEYY
jgi:hypothetical protein